MILFSKIFVNQKKYNRKTKLLFAEKSYAHKWYRKMFEWKNEQYGCNHGITESFIEMLNTLNHSNLKHSNENHN